MELKVSINTKLMRLFAPHTVVSTFQTESKVRTAKSEERAFSIESVKFKEAFDLRLPLPLLDKIASVSSFHRLLSLQCQRNVFITL